MYKWNIDIYLKGSGIVQRCRYDGPEDNTVDVFMSLSSHKRPNDVIDLQSDDGKSHMFITVGEIAAVDISGRKR